MSEALADVREGFSKKEIKMAIGVASDPRYKQGNYTGAVNAIEKIKKGLSKHPQVAAVLKRQNEEVELGEDKEIPDMIKHYEDMLKSLERKKKKTPGMGFAKMKIKEIIAKLKKDLGESLELDEKVKEYKGVAYFKTRKDAEEHMKKFAPKGRVVEFGRGYAVQTKISGPYLNKSGKTEEVELDEGKMKGLATMAQELDIDSKDVDKLKQLMVIYTRAMKLPSGSPKADAFKREIQKLRKDLNMESIEVEDLEMIIEGLDKEDTPKVKAIIKKLKGASQAHAGQAKDLQKAIDEMKEPFAVVDTADGDKVVGTASSEKGAKEIITTAQLPPMKIKDKKTLKIVKVKKKQNIGYPLKEGTWAIPETPAQKRDLKRLMSKPLPLGKEGDNAANKMYSIIGDDELFDDLYVAGKKDPEGDARPIIKKAMKRLKIREDRWFDRDTWRLDESTKPDHIKVFNSLKKGDKVEINYDSSMAGGSTKTFVIRTKNKVYKGKVDKVTMYPDGKTGGVKFHLYQYDNRPGVYMAIGDMGASLRDIKKL